MKTEDLKIINDELKEEIKKNNKQITVSDERKRMAKVNQFEYKFFSALFFSILPYVGLFILFQIFTANDIMALITNTIPVKSLFYIIVGSSLGIGIIGTKILEWKFKVKERFKSFTKAKTEYGKIKEEIKYSIELEKANNRNRTIRETMDLLRSNQLILNSLHNIYDNNINVSQNIEECKNIVDELSMLLNEKYKELDILTTQKVLHERFKNVRTKAQQTIDIIGASLMGGMLSLIYVDMPFIIMGISETLVYNSLPAALIATYTPYVIGIAGVSAYMIKRNKNYTKVFNSFNKNLDENALPEKIKDPREEQLNIDAKIESKIREISIARAQLQEQKRIMESYAENDEKKEKEIETSLSKEHTTEETLMMSEELLDETNEDSQIKENGPVLKKTFDRR